MTKSKKNKKQFYISAERLAELQRATIIASTGSTLRLSGSKVTNEQVEEILRKLENKI